MFLTEKLPPMTDKTTKEDIWEKSYSSVQDNHSWGTIVSKFVAQSGGEAMTVHRSLTLQSSILDIADKIAGILKKKNIHSVIKSDEIGWLAVEGKDSSGQTAAIVIVGDDAKSRRGYPAQTYGDENDRDEHFFAPKIGVYNVFVCSNRDIISFISHGLTTEYKDERFARIKWWYEQIGEGQTYKITYLDNPNTMIRQEFYPDIKSPDRYIEEYLASPASVLLMAGPPGTGKTTLLRHMIYKHDLTASVVYDESIMAKDSVFQSFLFSKEDDVLIIEDADVILTSRDKDNNKMMSRFLNVSDGLIKLPNKKLIFTTNISDFSKVDSALMRPGRCFDVLKTRELNLEEAQAAAKAANLAIPMERREYTVAELFHQGTKQQKTRRIGYV